MGNPNTGVPLTAGRLVVRLFAAATRWPPEPTVIAWIAPGSGVSSMCNCACKCSCSSKRDFLNPCFPGDTKILTPSGLRDLETLKSSEDVVGYSDEGFDIRPVLRLIRKWPARISHAHFDDGSILKATPNHSFLTPEGWLRLQKFEPGTSVMSIGTDHRQTWRKVTRVDRHVDRVMVFNLHTAGNHTFVADGVVAHAFSIWRRPRCLLSNALAGTVRSPQQLAALAPSV